MMSNDALILDLSADLAPVRRRSMAREIGLLLALAGVELAFCLQMGLMRPDMGQMIASPYMVWKLGSLALLAGVSAVVATRSFSPLRSPRRGLMLALLLAGAAILVGLFVHVDSDMRMGSTLLERLSPLHGLLCATSIVVLSLPVLAAMGAIMRRGAPVYPKASALAAGLASGTIGALIFAFCCPMNDPLYVILWYFLGCGVVTMAARWLLPRHFRL